MTDISKRIKALFFLRAIFLISLVAGFGSFIVEGIAMSFGESHVFSEGGAMTIYVFTSIFLILRLSAIVLSAATFVLTMKINKECMGAFITALIAAVLAIASGILQYIPDAKVAALVLSLISNLGLAAAVFLLIDGIFEQKARKTSLFGFAMLGICLSVISSVLSFLTYFVSTPEGLLSAIYSSGQVTYILSSVILFMAIHNCLKEIENTQESEAIQQ
ncbi:MAG: hypothetical protein IJU64_01710 [Bacilli bacterium]|nr:hypothetical protein [Bacilli bacterium]